jgi:hypothetical protein
MDDISRWLWRHFSRFIGKADEPGEQAPALLTHSGSHTPAE